MTASNGNGIATLDGSRLLPTSVTFTIAGTDVTAEYKTNEKKEVVFSFDAYFGVEDPETNREELLNDLPVEFLGTLLTAKAPGAHTSSPRKYGKKSKEGTPGDPIPNTGGNWTCNFVGLADIAGHSYAVSVWVTILDRDDMTEARANGTAKPVKVKVARAHVGSI